MKAKKENKIYQINGEIEKQRYLKDGYDIYDDEGKLLEYSPLKKIAYSDYDKLVKENASLKAENESMRMRLAELEVGTNADVETKIGKKAASKKAGE